jgi:DNA-binding transcriptional regulator YiaG
MKRRDETARRSSSPPFSGHELKIRRRALGLTQPQLAQALDVHPMTISKWERGVERPYYPAMLRLALDQLAEQQEREETT